ncbi:15-hydroxyprostaglandin dehydrogenase [NAD(+)] [Trichoplax sp. H2]|nr:15-hydroxyprostaglandin dehydrogenase [NAD(+)] [Trichoplax sp. H2]|eukprot:RDD43068.1 15-hydroxyprostaglandin dehydrogenase [NAD(+)] [Trichoplax sp. H2]
MKIEGKTAIVTGGAQGIGEQFCRALVDHGANVIIADLKKQRGEDLCRELNKQHRSNRAKFIQCDVTSKADLQNTIHSAIKTFGRLDILCNNAGVTEIGNWEKAIEINFTSVIRGTKLAIEVMSTRNGGHGGVIINTASMGAIFPIMGGPVYSGTKFGVLGFSRSLSNLNASDGIRVNVICPAFVRTEMFEASIPNYIDSYGNDFQKKMKKHIVSPVLVARGMIQLVEDDTKNDAVMRVTGVRGIDYYKFQESKL